MCQVRRKGKRESILITVNEKNYTSNLGVMHSSQKASVGIYYRLYDPSNMDIFSRHGLLGVDSRVPESALLVQKRANTKD